MTQDNGGMIKLYGCAPAWSLPDCSPFVMKIDCYLRMTGLQYELVHWQSLSDMQRAPKGKIPWIEDGAKQIADSGFIISYLQETYGDGLEENSFSPSDRAVALSMRRMVEEHLYWAVFFDRWIDDDIWASYKPILFGICTPQEYEIVPVQIRDIARQYIHGQGLGRYSRAEIHELGNADTSALAAYLGDRPYFMGRAPASLDATMYGFLAHLIYAGYESPLNSHARSFVNLRSYCERMRTRYYGS